MWDCEDIEMIALDILSGLDANGDGFINLGDLEAGHLEELNMYCDFNGDEQVDGCEVHTCVVMIENDWRSYNCPDYGMAYCTCEIPTP